MLFIFKLNFRRLQDQIGRLNSIPKRKEEYSRQFTNKTDRQLNQVKSALQQVDHDEIQRFKEEYHEEDASDEELVNPNSPEEILRYTPIPSRILVISVAVAGKMKMI